MKKITQNSFSKGLNMDLNPLSTPKDVLTDCLNGTIITFNGDEFSLQTEMGNSKVIVSGQGENALPAGFIPIGIKEFNNILYIVAHNPITKESQIGSFPSPQRYVPMQNSDTDNLTIRTVYDTNGSSVWEWTKKMSAVDYINHGMNTLTSYLNIGDRYRIIIKIGNANTTWDEAEPILKKFINNYGIGGTGYFDLKYYTYNSEGIYRELNVNITPSANSSEIEYRPISNTSSNFVNGVTKVNSIGGNSVIVASLTPTVISKFDFRLQGYNAGGVLRAKVVFDKDLVDDSNSAVKLTTVKVETTNSEFEDKTVSYYDYATYTDTLPVAIEKQADGVPVSFTKGTIITTTCTPIDQLGREMTTLAVTKTYEVTSLLLGTSGHNLFNYKVEGGNLTLNYNFINEGSGITKTQVEFYDFWSGVSVLTPLLPFTDPLNRTVTLVMPITNAYPKDQLFNSALKGGIPVTSLSAPSVGSNTLGTYITNLDLRADHCYLVRIFATDENIDYSIFQLLYTLPIAEFVDNYGIVDNFGVLDIINGISTKSLISSYTGDIFGTNPISYTPTSVTIDSSSCNYGSSPELTSEPFHLYGGPVFEEEKDGLKATWKNGNRYYRNMYTGSFEKEEKNLTKIGYHNFPESSIRELLTSDSSIGTALPNTLFENSSKNYLKGGLIAAGTNSQKDFRFEIAASMTATAPTLSGTVTILPDTVDGHVFFGLIDMTSFNKRIKLDSYTSTPITNLNQQINFNPDSITENLIWTPGATNVGTPTHSSKARIEVISGTTSDTVYIRDFSLTSQRFTYGNSGFKYYIHKALRNKLLSYFSLNHTQTIKTKVNDISETYDVSKHQEYLFSGELDTNFDMELDTLYALSKYNIVETIPSFTATLMWSNVISTFNLVNFIKNIGSVVLNIEPSYTEFTSFSTSSNSTRKLIFAKALYSPNQYVYSTFKWSTPTQLKIKVSESDILYTYNNLWRWSDPTNPYVAIKDDVSQEYLSNLISYQFYQEVAIAQYPSSNYIHNTSSDSHINVLNNNLEYYISVDDTNRDKHLTRTCFGTNTLENFSINKFASIIDKWHSNNIAVSKLIYNFTDIDISEGLAKNIPWNFGEQLISTKNIVDLSLTLRTAAPDAHMTLFSNSSRQVDGAGYVNTITFPVSPYFKIIRDNQAVNVTTSYFAVENSSSSNNIDSSPSMVIPVLNKNLLLTRTTSIPSTYGITYKLLNPPTLDQIYNGFTVKVGDYFGGGVVIKVNTDPISGKVTGGLIGATTTSKGGATPAYIPSSFFYQRLSGELDSYQTGATSITDGWNNTQKLLLKSTAKELAVKYCTSYNGGGYTDWYMPAQEELRSFLTFSTTSETSLLSNVFYWSSTEFAWDLAVACKRGSSGAVTVDTYKKNNTIAVIPIRKF